MLLASLFVIIIVCVGRCQCHSTVQRSEGNFVESIPIPPLCRDCVWVARLV